MMRRLVNGCKAQSITIFLRPISAILTLLADAPTCTIVWLRWPLSEHRRSIRFGELISLLASGFPLPVAGRFLASLLPE